MNITLVITGLATCGSLLFAGVDWQWGQEDDCGQDVAGVGVDLRIGDRAAAGQAQSSQQSDDAGGFACGDDDDP